MVVYLGISGVLHPSWSFYRYVYGREAEQDGHRKYQSVNALDEALNGWPAARIVLTSTQPWSRGLEAVLEQLGPLAHRVEGFTFEDLTKKVPADRLGRCISEMDYWRLVKSQIVRRHVEWLKPVGWVAVDDEDIGWAEDELPHVVVTSGSRGLADPEAIDRLYAALEHSFGHPAGGRTM
jgi:HAD domain in Swiss Army Knife RNA repair proteins